MGKLVRWLRKVKRSSGTNKGEEEMKRIEGGSQRWGIKGGSLGVKGI